MTSKEDLWQQLKSVSFPGFPDRNVLGVVKELSIAEDGSVAISLAVGHLGKQAQQAVVDVVSNALLQLSSVQSVQADIIQMQPPQEEAQPQRPGIRHVIAVGSGKGGVGKSTIAVNLAVGLAQQGLRVGLMDADIFGPNVPRMLGVGQLPPREGEKITPAEAHGVKFVSIGLLVEPEKAVVWRGPMTDKLMRQFMHGVAWGELDALVVDLPPGTGDIAISLSKYAQPDGAIVVVTPQEVALDDARKAVTMFRRMEIPILGVVENMSYYECPGCGERQYLFGQGGGRRLAEEMAITLLGEVPMVPAVREGGDVGVPALLDEASTAAVALRELAAHVYERIA